MANIVIWGRARDIVSGDLPPSASVVEVDTLQEVRQRIDGSGSTLILADPTRIAAERDELETWIRAEGATKAVLVPVVDPGDAEVMLKLNPFLDEVLLRPVTANRLRLRLERAFETVHNRRLIRQLERALDRKSENLEALNKIGVALSVERDIDNLLKQILAKSREITTADAGSLYLVDRGKDDDTTRDDRLRFKLTQNDSVDIPFQESVIPLDQTSIAGYAALGQIVNVADAYNLPPGSPFTVSRSFDEKSGYRTKSMLAVPMRDHLGKIIGVVQLINKKTEPETTLRSAALVDEAVIPFTKGDEELVRSLASQAAVAYENTLLIANMKTLFESFVRASVTTIEKRDPTTSGHSERVATLTVDLAEKVNNTDSGPFRDQHFTPDQIQEIRYASLLHDFGKVGVKEKYLLKERKLYDSHLDLIVQRFEYVQRTLEVEHLEAKMRQIEARAPRELIQQMDHAFQARREELSQLIDLVRKANKPSIEDGEYELTPDLAALAGRTYRDLAGNEHPFLTAEELEALGVRRGSLTSAERESIKEHVTNTYEFLKELPWTGELKKVPEIAWAHHEKLDGSGYPRKLKAADIKIQPRMMTISDIFDALVATDRPYKPAVSEDRALDILVGDARKGWIDRDLLEIFISAKVYEKTRGKTGAEAELIR
jgi:HD-GYP domain-containing protein (c-di-GMP phosphodiesterase class II)